MRSMPILSSVGLSSGEPFVQQEELRAGRQRAGEFDALLVDIGELRADELGPVRETDPVEEGVGLGQRRGGICRIAAEHPAEHDVLARRRAGKDAHELERPGDASAAYLEGSDADDLIALKDDRPGVRRQFSSDEVEDGGLARAVRADEAGDAAGGDIEGEVADGDETAESFPEAVDAEQGARRRTGAVADHEPRARPGEAAHEGVKGGAPVGDRAHFRCCLDVCLGRVFRRLPRRRGARRAAGGSARAGEHAEELLDPRRESPGDKIHDDEETDAERDGEVSGEGADEKVGQKDQQDGADRGAPGPARTAEQGGDQHLE